MIYAPNDFQSTLFIRLKMSVVVCSNNEFWKKEHKSSGPEMVSTSITLWWFWDHTSEFDGLYINLLVLIRSSHSNLLFELCSIFTYIHHPSLYLNLYTIQNQIGSIFSWSVVLLNITCWVLNRLKRVFVMIQKIINAKIHSLFMNHFIKTQFDVIRVSNQQIHVLLAETIFDQME